MIFRLSLGNNVTVYLDACQFEINSRGTATTYIDGDQPGCQWSADWHGSTSRRSENSRDGGKIIDFDALGLNVMMAQGIGFQGQKHLVDMLPNLPGGLYRGRDTMPAMITLSIWAPGSSLANLHALRKELIDAIHPDRVRDDQSFILRYSGISTNIPVIKVTYDSGLEFNNPNVHLETINLRLIAYDPYWYELGEAA